jgi:hypothetical protein
VKLPAVSLIRGLGRRLAIGPEPSGLSGAPVGMLDVERITRVAPPISTLTSRPAVTPARSNPFSRTGH